MDQRQEAAGRIFVGIAPMIRAGKQPGSVKSIAGTCGVPEQLAREALHWMADEGWITMWRNVDDSGKARGTYRYGLPAEEYRVDSAPDVPAEADTDRMVPKPRPTDAPPNPAEFDRLCELAGRAIMACQTRAERLNARREWNEQIFLATGIKMMDAESQELISMAVDGTLARAQRGGMKAPSLLRNLGNVLNHNGVHPTQ